jgi:hypothetical protein
MSLKAGVVSSVKRTEFRSFINLYVKVMAYKVVRKIKVIHVLVQRLNSAPTLGYSCGFDVLKPAPF